MNSSLGYSGITRSGLSHSEIHGSAPACGSPWLIATCYVLHRLLAPRHSPFALSSLITKFTHLTRSRGLNGNSANCNLPYLFFYLCVVVKEHSRPAPNQGFYTPTNGGPVKLFGPSGRP